MNTNKELYEKMPVGRAVLTLAVPTVIIAPMLRKFLHLQNENSAVLS